MCELLSRKDRALSFGSGAQTATPVLASAEMGRQADVRFGPVFGEPCFSLAVEGIFSAALGDVMYAALRATLKKSGKEGFGWKSIPLKA